MKYKKVELFFITVISLVTLKQRILHFYYNIFISDNYSFKHLTYNSSVLRQVRNFLKSFGQERPKLFIERSGKYED